MLVTGIQGFAGSLAVGAAAAVAADLVLALPARPAMGGLLAVFGVGFLAAVLQQMFRRPRTDLVASLAGTALLLAVTGALATLLLLGRTDAGHGRALVALLAVGAALVVGHLADLVLPRPQLAEGVPCGLLALVLSVVARRGGHVPRPRRQRHRRPAGRRSSTAPSSAGWPRWCRSSRATWSSRPTRPSPRRGISPRRSGRSP